MNVKKLIEILQRLPGDLEIMMPMEGNVDRAKAIYVAKVAKTRRDWAGTPVGNFLTLGNDELTKEEETIGEPFQVVMLDFSYPSWISIGEDGQSSVIDLEQVNALIYRGLTVPVWQTATCSTPFIRYNDLPADLADAFERWQYGAAMPFHRAAYHHDFEIFMSRGGKAEDAEIVRRYL